MANLARRYTQDLAVAADDGDRRRRHRRRNLFARADRSLERVTGAGDKLYRAMARRRCAALPPPWLSSVPAIGFVQVWFSPAQGRQSRTGECATMSRASSLTNSARDNSRLLPSGMSLVPDSSAALPRNRARFGRSVCPISKRIFPG